MSISPIMDSPIDVDGINSIRMNLNNDFTDLCEEKKNLASETLPVFIRIRPMLSQEHSQGYTDCLSILNNCYVRATAPPDSAKFRNMDRVQDFTFTNVFSSEVTQLSLFEETMNSAVKSFIKGQNALIFAYGSSGSGKTYTMLGNEKEPGIIPLTVQLFFQSLQEKQVPSVSFRPYNACEVIQLEPSEIAQQSEDKEKLLMSFNEDMDYTKASCSSMGGFDVSRISDAVLQELSSYPAFTELESQCRSFLELQGDCYYSCWVSFLELYNERIYDLFKPFTKKKRQALALGEDQEGNIFVKGLKEIHVSSISEVLKLLRLGKRNLNIATTKLNYQSSRSHCIFNIKVIRVTDPKNPSKVFVNNLSFCDLAGSERCGKTKNTGVRLKEASNINASLMVLGRCIEMLRQNQILKEKKLIPFRESKLTRLFSSFFIGKGKASMIVNVSPSSHTFDETSNVLKFSALAQQVTMKESSFRQELSRFTDFITSDRLSISGSRESMDHEFDYSMALDERDGMLKEIVEIARNLESELKKERQENAEMEARIRSQLTEEYTEYFSEVGNFYKKKIQELRSYNQKKSDKRFKEILQILHPDSTKESSSSDEEDEDDDFQKETSSGNKKDVDMAAISTVQQEVLALKTKVQEQEAKLQASEKSLSEANAVLSSKNKVIEERDKHISDLEGTISTFEQKVETKSSELKKLQATLTEKSDSLSTYQRKIKELEKTLSAMENGMSDLKNKEEEIEKLKSQVVKFEGNFSKQEAHLTEQKNTVSRLESELSKKHDDAKEHAKNSLELKASMKTLESQLSKVKDSEKSLKATIDSKTGELAQKDKKIVQFETTVKSMEEQIKEHSSMVHKHEQSLTDKLAEMKEKEKVVMQLQEKITKLGAELDAKSKKIEGFEVKIKKDTETSLAREQHILELQTSLSNAENQLKMSNVPHQSSSQQTDLNYEKELCALREAHQEVQLKLKDSDNNVKKADEELQSRIADLAKEKEYNFKLEKTISSKNEQLKVKDETIESMKGNLSGKMDDMSKKCSDLLQATASKDEQLKAKEQAIQEMQDNFSAKTDDLYKKLAEFEEAAELKDEQLKAKEQALQEMQKNFSGKTDDLYKKLAEFEEGAGFKDEQLKAKEQAIQEMQKNFSAKTDDLYKKLAEFEEGAGLKEEQLKAKEQAIQEMQKNFSTKTDDLYKKLAEFEEGARVKDEQLKAKEQAIQEIQKNFSAKTDDLYKKLAEFEEGAGLKTKEDEKQKEITKELHDKVVSLTKEDEKQKEITKELNDKVVSLTKDVEERKEIANELYDKVASLNSIIAEHETNLSKTTEILLQKQNKIDSLSDTISQLEAGKAMQATIEPISKEPGKEIEVQTDQIQVQLNRNQDTESQTDHDLPETDKEEDITLDDIDEDVEKSANGELQYLVELLQKIERCSAKKYEGIIKKGYQRIQLISEMLEKNSELASSHDDLNSKLQNCDRMIAAKDSSIKDLEKALKDQKNLEQAERDMYKNQYETEIEKLKALKESFEDENMKLKEELKFKEIPESEEKVEVFLKPKASRARKGKNLLEISVQTAANDSEGTRSKRKGSIDVKDTIVDASPPPKPKANQRRKKATSLDLSNNSLSNGSGDSEPKTDASDSVSPKPRLRGGRKQLVSLDQSSSKESVADVDSEPKTDISVAILPKPKLRGKRKQSHSLEQSSSKESLANDDNEPKSDEIAEKSSPKPKGKPKKKAFPFDQSKDNSDTDFEPRKKTSGRATRATSVAVNDEPKKTGRPSRVSHKKSTKTAEVEELKEAPKGKLTRGQSIEEPKKAPIAESPLEKIKNFVTGAVPKFKSAVAEQVSSILSPATAKKDITAPASTRRKRKLFNDGSQPILAEVSPAQKDKEPSEKRTRGRPKRSKK